MTSSHGEVPCHGCSFLLAQAPQASNLFVGCTQQASGSASSKSLIAPTSLLGAWLRLQSCELSMFRKSESITKSPNPFEEPPSRLMKDNKTAHQVDPSQTRSYAAL